MICLFVIAIISSFCFSMDPYTKQKREEFENLSLKEAKDKISTAIAYDESHDLKLLLSLFGAQISQEEKNEYLLRCYARPYSAPLILALGANPNIHAKQRPEDRCDCAWSPLPGLPHRCKKYSILHEAAERGNPLVVKALLEHGALVDPLDVEKGETPLMKACRLQQINGSRGDNRYLSDYYWTIKHLLNAGADSSLQNAAGKTAREIAQEIADSTDRTTIVGLLPIQKIR